MKKIGLNLGQRIKLKQYIEYVNQNKINNNITENSTKK